MKKRLLYNFYINRDTLNFYSNKIHFVLLRKYSYIFDEIYFNLSVDDVNDTELIRAVELKLLQLHTKGRIVFTISENNKFRESQLVYDEIYKNECDDALVFFGHNKGLTNYIDPDNQYNKDSLDTWIVGLYYFSFIDINEIENELIGFQHVTFGPYLIHSNLIFNKHKHMYMGTFYWVNLQSLRNHIQGRHYGLNNRFFSELMLGEFVQFDVTSSRGDCYLRQTSGDFIPNFFEDADTYTKMIYSEEDVDAFYKFKEEILNEVRNEEDIEI